MKIRIAPSGHFVNNTEGGLLEFGPGAVLRERVTNSPLGTAPLTGTPVVLAVVESLAAPQTALKYSAELNLDLANEGAGPGQVAVVIETSVDNVTWTPRASAAVYVGGNTDGVLEAQHVTLKTPILTGTALGVVTGTTAQLQVRATIAAPSGSVIRVQATGGTGTQSIVLTERF